MEVISFYQLEVMCYIEAVRASFMICFLRRFCVSSFQSRIQGKTPTLLHTCIYNLILVRLLVARITSTKRIYFQGIHLRDGAELKVHPIVSLLHMLARDAIFNYTCREFLGIWFEWNFLQLWKHLSAVIMARRH